MPSSVRLLLSCLLSATLFAQDPVDDLLRSLDVEQKAGQLFMVWSLSRAEVDAKGAANHERLLRQVAEAQLGGVILSLGTVDDAAALVPRLQAAAKIPLLLASDFEGGVWHRLGGATELGNQMLVGATGSSELAEAMGRVTGEEARALGFHLVFAPVLDVNSNPDNPIINVRSFGEDPALVARLGSAFARGVRGTGLLACGKHFPGHGDVDTDSHLALATVPGDAARLRSVELRPFAAAAREGLEAVMTGHLGVPGLGEAPDVPATLSHKILHDVLRKELGFRGLIVTDALEMGGVKNAFPPGEVAVRALLAGADVLLMPPEPMVARQAVVDAVRSGRVPIERLDDAVRRILQAKQRVGLLAGGGMVLLDWRERVNTAPSRWLAATIAERGLTLVRDRDGNLPLRAEEEPSSLLVTLADDGDATRGSTFAAELSARVAAQVTLTTKSTAAEIGAVAERVAAAQRVVLALCVKVREYSGGVALPPALQPVLDALHDDQRVVAVSFGNPYLVRHLPQVDTYLCAYVATPGTERAAAWALRGVRSVHGRLPVSIPGVARAGDGLSLYEPTAGMSWQLERAELPPDLPARLDELLRQAVADGAFPGAVCLVARHGIPFAASAVGRLAAGDDEPPVRLDTPFDLASLTKVCATTPAVLRLVAGGRLSLDDPVVKWLPAFAGDGRSAVTLRQLLSHEGGLPPFQPYWRTLRGRDAIVAAACAEPLVYQPGEQTVYSDIGFVLLMAVVEACAGESFEAFVRRECSLSGARFAPTDGEAIEGAAATELDPSRGGLVRGFVHDENAFAMGGVSGHAGLFATGLDVLHYGLALLQGGGGLLPRDLVEQATRVAGTAPGSTRGLGFQLLQSGTWAGTNVPSGTFGHTGFTGTSLWCCPRFDVCVVLLTNRVSPTRANGKITAVRRAVHDLVLDSLR